MIILDYSDKRPIYEQIVERFETLILNGALEPDQKMPSVRSLAVELSINPNTIQRAYAQLERDGYLYTIKGRGSFVRFDESMMKKQQEKLLVRLSQVLEECKRTDISREEIIRCMEKYYEEGRV